MYEIKVGVLVEKDHKLLLIKRKNSSGEFCWTLIKGEMKEDYDEDLFAAIERLCQEQAKITVKLNSIVNILIVRKSSGNVIQFDFVVSYQDGNLTEDSRLFSREELVDMGPLDFFNSRTYAAVEDWINGKRVPVDIIENLTGRLYFPVRKRR